jgi:hypothetical protein
MKLLGVYNNLTQNTHTHTLPKVVASSTESSKVIGLEAFNLIIGPGIHMMPTTRVRTLYKRWF